MKKIWKSAEDLLRYLNETYNKLHKNYESLFWISAMGDRSVDTKKDAAHAELEAFKSNKELLATITVLIDGEKNETLKTRLNYWKIFLNQNIVPEHATAVRNKIIALESRIQQRRSKRKEGYINPKTKKFVKASINAMRSIIATNDSEPTRKACFIAIQELAKTNTADYIQLVQLRNEYAQILGYEDFYAYKLAIEEGMTKKELFSLWESIYEKTKYAFADIRVYELKHKKDKPNLRKPWNFGYMLAGNLSKEQDQYFPFSAAIERWARSFAALGINYRNGSLIFDLLDRKGKYNNGFCHWPQNVYYKEGKRIAGQAGLTCNVVPGVLGQSEQGYATLFHEGGHAAHLLNADMKDICINTEYPPLSTAWAETQSMFLDHIFSSVEWLSRYAKNTSGEIYPFELYERQARTLQLLLPLSLMSILMVCDFEREVYETKKLTQKKLLKIAQKHFKKHTDRSADSLSILEIPHIYSWDSACSYQGYGLAVLALSQWREYFYGKYGYIVDNPNVGKEMQAVWKYGGSKTFPEFVKLATGKKLSASAFLKYATMPIDKKIILAKKRIATLATKPEFTKELNLNVSIKVVDGKKTIADNRKGINAMAKKYAAWLRTIEKRQQLQKA
jgi:Zn-dependent oligopeptidase